MNARSRRPRRSAVGLVLVLLATAFLATEVAFRISDAMAGRDASFYLPQDLSSRMYDPHPYLGMVLRPGVSGGGKYKYHINALGMRGREITREKPPGVYRIACLGSSTTYGTGATSDEFTYPARLEMLLNKISAAGGTDDGRIYEVLNCGVSGWNTADSLVNLELRILDLQPDAVLAYDAANDGRIIQARGFVSDYSHMRRPPPIVKLPALEQFLLGHVRTYARLTHGTDPEKQFGGLAEWIFVDNYRALQVPST
ncbi:MAG TPA: SGNH/GDSL hydrolase family protein, partial [Planctomycetota bacterium]|nr:SGNH/GDSL hydrolase family protein [Planctomycetota bacterium]